MTLVPTSSRGGGSGTVTSVTATDASIVVAGTAAAPTLATATLDVIATLHPPAAAVAMNAKKITGLANATAATDALALGQVLAANVIPIADLVAGATAFSVVGGAGPAYFIPHGTVLAYGTRAAPVSTAGVTFGTGADLLAAALNFTADGTSDYELMVSATDWFNDTASKANIIALNLDGADAGSMTGEFVPTDFVNKSLLCIARGFITAPAAGAHTVNARLYVSGGTGTVDGGAGGAGTGLPILATLRKL